VGRRVMLNTRFLVMLDNGAVVSAYAFGKTKKRRIRILAMDNVARKLSPNDLAKARISFRHKDERSAPSRIPRPPQFRRSRLVELHVGSGRLRARTYGFHW
jgi:translation initiation factor IF-1